MTADQKGRIRHAARSIDEQFHDIILAPFEYWLWKTRYIAALGVLFSAFAAITLFIMGTIEILVPITNIMHTATGIAISGEGHSDHEAIITAFIGAIDLYLIGVFFLIFSFGLYEIVISKIDVARDASFSEDGIQLLQISSLDELKSKIIKVIIMVLIVSFFQKVIALKVDLALDALLFAMAILSLCIGSYLLHLDHS
ncbi:MAG TPA: YqhA family protein [Methanospirillum sp.]|nr:YqhA family protein [Methanospirillum sp.]